MTSRADAERQLRELLGREVLDIHGVAELLQMQRSSVNTLIVRPKTEFPAPIFELRGNVRHPLRLWWRADVEIWAQNRKRKR